MVADHRQQGEGHHHQTDVPVPAVPGTGFVVIEPELSVRAQDGGLGVT